MTKIANFANIDKIDNVDNDLEMVEGPLDVCEEYSACVVYLVSVSLRWCGTGWKEVIFDDFSLDYRIIDLLIIIQFHNLDWRWWVSSCRLVWVSAEGWGGEFFYSKNYLKHAKNIWNISMNFNKTIGKAPARRNGLSLGSALVSHRQVNSSRFQWLLWNSFKLFQIGQNLNIALFSWSSFRCRWIW